MSQVSAAYFRVYDGTYEVFATKDLEKLTEHILKNRTRYSSIKRDYVRYIVYSDSGDVVYNSPIKVYINDDNVIYFVRKCRTLYTCKYESKKEE